MTITTDEMGMTQKMILTWHESLLDGCARKLTFSHVSADSLKLFLQILAKVICESGGPFRVELRIISKYWNRVCKTFLIPGCHSRIKNMVHQRAIEAQRFYDQRMTNSS